ncbi:hypothetical protein B0J12DRAFT_709672 [Macrophomina phaseolina]|uniref:Uncharacterized protein n=1 Tax=Macrophomina phaseolina TaxID=35725 RepID=A0ABQ8GHS5_9PEZI|nr:hypothetical protein B0J12DRAFT_709672 [Macrophomina phaseolina]
MARAIGQPLCCARAVSTLPNNPHIYVHTDPVSSTHTLTLTPTTPPVKSLSLGTTTAIPPTPNTFRENPTFHGILQSVIAAHAVHDPEVQAQAAAYASQSGASNIGERDERGRRRRRRRQRARGMGGAGRGGWVHVSDQRNPPDYGRIAWPEDMFGSVEVDARGAFVGADGNYQQSGTYRLCTNEGILGLSKYLRERVVERVRELEVQERAKGN